MTLILYDGLSAEEILVVCDAFYILGERAPIMTHLTIEGIIANGESELLI